MPSLHATAVAIGGAALLIRGASRSGKSRLAFALIARSVPMRPVTLVGDDRLVVTTCDGALVVEPHPRIAGFMERRGLGIVAMPWVDHVTVAGMVVLGSVRPAPALAGLPCLQIAAPCDIDANVVPVLSWWSSEVAARATHPSRKGCAAVR